MANIAELFSQKNVLDYTANRVATPLLGEQLFPSRKIEGLEFDMLKAGSRIPTIASVHAFDTEAEIASRIGSRSAQELAFIKRKIPLKEKDLMALRNPRTPAEQKYLEEEVYNDVYSMVTAVEARVEKMRMEALVNGKIELNENGLEGLVVDYGVPADHQATKDWTAANADILGDLEDFSDALDIKPTRILTSKKVRNLMTKNKAILALFKDAGMLPSKANLNNLLESLDLPTIVTYDEKYKVQGADGKYTTGRYFPEDKLVLFGDSNPGESVFGTTPEESRLLSGGSKDYKVGNILYISSLIVVC